MKISQAGLDLIKEFEGYHKALPDGSCCAYQERLNGGKLDIPTIGYGVTEGVKMGMVWTREQAEVALRRELAKHEAIVARLVTVDLTQHQFDALVSFNYNVGKLAQSTLLRKLNAGDVLGAAEQFRAWNKAGGHVQPGLVRRRSAEKALFLKPDEPEHMPQQADDPGMSTGAKAGVAGTGILGAGVLTDPVGLTSTLVSVKGNTVQLLSGVPLTGLLVPLLILTAACAGAYFYARK